MTDPEGKVILLTIAQDTSISHNVPRLAKASRTSSADVAKRSS